MLVSKRKLRMLVVHITYAACTLAHAAGGFSHTARNAHVIPQDARDDITPRRNRSAFP